MSSGARLFLHTSAVLGVDFLPLADALAPSAGSAAPLPSAPAPGVPHEVMVMTNAPGRSSTPRAARLSALLARYRAFITATPPSTPWKNVVFGEGDPDASLMFVGEAPGQTEDETGRPFVGAAGLKLSQMITAMGLARESVYIANVVKLRPPNNRTPLPMEVARDAPFLREQIEIIRPRAIVALGGPAAKFLLDTELGITRLRGKWAKYRDGDIEVDVMPTFHPAYLLRNYTRETRERVWSDLKAAMAVIAKGT